jgi:GT2 family glycosyltransferase
MRAATTHPDIASFACRMMLEGAHNVLDGAGDVYHVSGLAWRADHGRPLAERHLVERDVFGACGGAALYRLDGLRGIGGFDEDLFCYLEDVDVAFRLQRAGRRCLYVPSAVVCHVGGASTPNNPEFRLYHGHRNMIRVYLKNMPTMLLIATLPLHIAVNLMALVRSIWRGDVRIVARAKLDALHALPRVLAQRRSTRMTDVADTRTVWRSMSKAFVRNVRTSS